MRLFTFVIWTPPRGQWGQVQGLGWWLYRILFSVNIISHGIGLYITTWLILKFQTLEVFSCFLLWWVLGTAVWITLWSGAFHTYRFIEVVNLMVSNVLQINFKPILISFRFFCEYVQTRFMFFNCTGCILQIRQLLQAPWWLVPCILLSTSQMMSGGL